MAQKLFRVDCSAFATVYAVGETLNDAIKATKAYFDECLTEWEYDASEAKPGRRVYGDWANEFPYGDFCGKTVAEWLNGTAEEIAEREAAEKARREFDAHPKLLEV